MIEIPASVTVAGAKGEVPFPDVFEERRMLVAYFHVWHDGQPREGQWDVTGEPVAQADATTPRGARTAVAGDALDFHTFYYRGSSAAPFDADGPRSSGCPQNGPYKM